MNRTQRVDALKQVIAHTIKGERDLAEALFKQVTAASAREILGEANYAMDDDPEFDGRREMQRELEDDLESGQMEPGADEMGGSTDALGGEGDEVCPECGSEPCECPSTGEGGDADKTVDDIVSKLEAGTVDDQLLTLILAMVNAGDEEGGEDDQLPMEPTEGEPSMDEPTDGAPTDLPPEDGEGAPDDLELPK